MACLAPSFSGVIKSCLLTLFMLQNFNEFEVRFMNVKERAKEIDFDQVHRWQGVNTTLKAEFSSLSSVRSIRRMSLVEKDNGLEKVPSSSSFGHLPAMSERDSLSEGCSSMDEP